MHRIVALALAAVLAAATPARAQTKWVMATPYPDANFHTQTVKFFLAEVEKAAPGKLAVQLHPNASLLPLLQIKRAVQTGQVQMGEILLGAYGNEDPIFEVDFIPFLAPPPTRRPAPCTRRPNRRYAPGWRSRASPRCTTCPGPPRRSTVRLRSAASTT